MKTLRYIIGQAARAIVSMLVAVAVMLLLFDWMITTFDTLSAIFVLAFVSCVIGGVTFLWLDSLEPAKKR